MATDATMTMAQLRALPFETRARAVELLGLVPARCPGCGDLIGSPACACGGDPVLVAPDDATVGDDRPAGAADQALTLSQEEGLNAGEGQPDTSDHAPADAPDAATASAPEPVGHCDSCGEPIYDASIEHDCTGAAPDAE